MGRIIRAIQGPLRFLRGGASPAAQPRQRRQPAEEHGNITLFNHDVAEREGLEEALREAVARESAARLEAERAKEARGQFIAALAHELRAPLQAIVGWSAALLQQSMDPQSREMAERLRVNSELMRRLIDEVMDLSRIDVGKMSLHRERIDLRELLSTTLARLQPIPAEKGVTVRLLLEGCPAFVDADRCRLQQMVTNLLTNAVKFSPVGGTVTVSATERGQWAEVAVADSGAGFGGSGDRAFERFWQGGSSIEGLGLGLAIVHQLAELHGGSVRIASAVDGGGLVAFTLPVAQPAAPSDHVETRPPRQAPRGAEIYHVKAG